MFLWQLTAAADLRPVCQLVLLSRWGCSPIGRQASAWLFELSTLRSIIRIVHFSLDYSNRLFSAWLFKSFFSRLIIRMNLPSLDYLNWPLSAQLFESSFSRSNNQNFPPLLDYLKRSFFVLSFPRLIIRILSLRSIIQIVLESSSVGPVE